ISRSSTTQPSAMRARTSSNGCICCVALPSRVTSNRRLGFVIVPPGGGAGSYRSGGDGLAHRRPDPTRDGVARVLVEAARAAPLPAVSDAEPLERVARAGHRRPTEVLEADVVGHAHALAELPLGEAHERAVHRLRA